MTAQSMCLIAKCTSPRRMALIISEDRSYHRYGNGGLGTRMCVLVTPDDYEKAKKLVL